MSPGRIALGYTAIAILWIAFSDAVVTHLKLDPAVMTIKGAVFVFVTASLLYFTTRRLVDTVRQSEAYLAEAQRLSHTGSWAFDVASDTYVYVSEECLRIFELDAQEDSWTREEVSRLIHPEDWPRVNEAFEQSVREKVDTSSEFRITLPSGAVKHVHAIRHPVLNDAGRIMKLVGTVIDITDRKHAEEKVRQQERELREILDVTPLLVAVFGPDRNRLYANRPTLDYFGVTLEEWLSISDPFWFFHPDDREHVANDVYTGPGSDAPHEFEARIRRKDGVYRWFLFRDNPLRDDQGHITRWYISATDIEDWKQAEQALRESEANLNRAQEIAHIGSWHLDIARNQLIWSDEVYRLFGAPGGRPLDYEAFLGMVHPEDRDRVDRAWAAALQGALYDIEHRIVVGNELKWVRERAVVEFDRAGKAVTGTGTVQDITERKKAEEALRRSEAYLAQAQRLTRTGSWVRDATGELVHLSEELYRIFGLDPQAGLPSRETLRRRVHPDDVSRAVESVEEALREKIDTFVEYRIVLPDGTIKHVQVIRHPVLNDRGDVVELVGTVIDITDRKRDEEALRQSEAYLAEAQRLSHTGSWAWDVARNIFSYSSEENSRIYGVDKHKDLNTDAVLRIVHPEDRERVKNSRERSLREKVDTSDEFRIVLPDGTVKHIHAIRHPILNDAGEVVQLVGTTMDITERKRAEDALRRSEAYLRETQRLAHAGSWVWDPINRKFLYASDEMLRLYGFDPAEGIPTPARVLERVHPDDRDKIKNTRTGSGDVEFDYKYVLPDGTLRHFHCIAHPVLGADGEAREVLGIAIDITDRKRAEDALRRSEAYLSEAQRVTHTGSFSYKPGGAILYWSDETLRIWGFDQQPAILTHEMIRQRIHPDDRGRVRARAEASVGMKTDWDDEFRILLPDGAVKHILAIHHPVFGASGELIEVVGTHIDITDRKRAEEALRESERRFRTFVDHAADAFFMLDAEEGTILDINQAACESLGYTREELLGMTPLAFDVDLDRATLKSIAERAAAGATVVFDRHRHRRKDASQFPVEIQTSVFWHGGRRFLLKVARDISDRVRAEEQRDRLRQVEMELAHINRVSMMGELAASIAHEVGQPLAGVVSNGGACLRWLAREVPNLEEAREAAKRIVRDGKRAGEIIARIRAMTKKAATPNETLALNDTIQDVVALVGDEAKRKSVTIRRRFTDELARVAGDRVQLQQVVLNLVMNGIEAMSSVADRPRELIITTRNLEPDQVQVTVEDAGTGLDPSTIDKIFDPFYTTKPTGMGMGLAICRSILQHHGGRLWATTKDSPGTMFHFTLARYHEEDSHA